MSANYLIIVAAGSGSRMKQETPKQFVQLNGKEIIVYTIQKFQSFDPEMRIIVAVHPDYFSLMNEISAKNTFKNILITAGGETRFHSVKNALSFIKEENSIVGIHDAARPLVSVETIKRCYELAGQKGNATPALEPHETLRQISEGKNKHVNRKDYRIIQTPQCFHTKLIQEAFKQDYSENFTDDASVFEAAGHSIYLVEGNPENMKITYPKDLIIAKALLENEQR